LRFAGATIAPVPTRLRRAALLCLASGALAACGGGTNLSPRYTILRNPPPTPNQLSRQVALIADSHAHYLYGTPTVIQTNVADWFSASAIRPPQADLWGWRFLRWTLGAIHADVPIIHLGDVSDISCASEFEHFLEEMAVRRRHGRHLGQPLLDQTGPTVLAEQHVASVEISAAPALDHVEEGVCK